MALLIKNARLVDPAVGLDGVGDVRIADDGTIAEVGQGLPADGCEVRDLTGRVLVPGLVDCHVHLREPGLEHKETIFTGTLAAAYGGFTDICSMPNTIPETDNADVIEFVKAQAAKAGHCHVHPSGACTKGRKGEALAEMGDMAAHGAVAFTDDGMGVQDAGMMRRVMDYAKQFGKVVMSHCQDMSLSAGGQVNEGAASTRLGLTGWPAAAEEVQIERDILISELTGCPIHIQHLTTRHAMDIVRAGKARGAKVTCEVTPHHMFLNEDDIREDYNANLKVNPPLRTSQDNEAVIEGVLDGTVDIIVTDHAPHAAHEKDREFELAPNGMIGIETSLPSVLTWLVQPGRIDYNRMVELMAINPRTILGIPQVKLEPGSVADLTAFDPGKEWDCTPDCFHSKSNNSGFIGRHFMGKATDTFVAGKPVLVEGEVSE